MKNRILFAAAECAPFVKVGGLADVIGSLPKALKKIGADVYVVIPYYESIKINKKLLRKEKEKIGITFGKGKEYFDLYRTFLPESNVPLLLIKNTELFKGEAYASEGDPYKKQEFEAARFFFFMKAATKVSSILKTNIIHCHDWHSSLIPLIAKKERLQVKTIITIHNIAYQGIFDSSVANNLLGTKLKGSLNCLRSGINNADLVTTVSSGYAKEILIPDFGFGLEKDLQERKSDLTGIINGIDPEQFSPENDPYIKKSYSLKTIALKKENKKFLQEKCFKRSRKKTVVVGMVSRLAEQKGFDLIEKIFSELIKKNIQLIVLGKGVEKYERFFADQSKKYPENVFVKIGFDEEFARQIYAGSDVFLMPSFFEPCGLGQLIAMKYGTVPIVREVGGLKDTVTSFGKPQGTGFLFKKYEPTELLKTIEKALLSFKNEKLWKKLQKNGMNSDFSWNNSAKKYLKLYSKLSQ